MKELGDMLEVIINGEKFILTRCQVCASKVPSERIEEPQTLGERAEELIREVLPPWQRHTK